MVVPLGTYGLQRAFGGWAGGNYQDYHRRVESSFICKCMRVRLLVCVCACIFGVHVYVLIYSSLWMGARAYACSHMYDYHIAIAYEDISSLVCACV